MKRILLILVCGCWVLNVFGLEQGGLILFGKDTITTPNQKGFDFVTQTSCSAFVNAPPYPCVNHFLFGINGFYSKYILQMDVQDGEAYFIEEGKMNLDSIKAALADSIFSKQPLGQGDSIPVDSLSSRIGNVYLMETAPDPRPVWAGVFFAKIKILGFSVVDSANHQIKMRFLWACQLSHARDLATTGLDTFHLDGTTVNQPSGRLASSVNRSSAGQYVFKVVGDKFTLPQELVGKVKWLTVWDLRGKRVGRMEIGTRADFDLHGFTQLDGIKIVKVH